MEFKENGYKFILSISKKFRTVISEKRLTYVSLRG